MAALEPTQVKLDKIVRTIASDMVAEVCSIYLRKAGEVLELYATHGLKQEAVHQTRLYMGEGLVGDIAAFARPLALSDAQAHPNFAYKPETGEEIYQSLLGVPILRQGHVYGVLVIQNKTRRQYTEEETEILETMAMVLAELAGNALLVSTADVAPSASSQALLPVRFSGVRLNGGLSMGRAVLHTRQTIVHSIVADDTDAELARLHAAIKGMQSEIARLLEQHHVGQHHESRDIIETYQMFAEDAGWAARIREAVLTGLTAEAAAQRVQNEMRARLSQVKDAYLKERLQDLEDLTSRLLHHLGGTEKQQLPDEPFILVARNMGPVELLDYKSPYLKGIVLEEGTQGAHVAIVARALNAPMIGQVQGILPSLDGGDMLIVDSDHAQVYLRPSDDLVNRYGESMRMQTTRQQQYIAESMLPGITLDGVRVDIRINAGFLADLDFMHQVGASGVGLLRTEIPFMARSDFPDVQGQAEIYSQVLDKAGDKPVVFRTLDVGGDKVLHYMPSLTKDENPAMGWRALRISLDRPALLRQQLRALLQAGAGRDLSIMFPMVAEVSEFLRARSILDMECRRREALRLENPVKLRVGAMLEVPALLWQLPALFAVTDFISIGSNDLLQFLFASDRNSPRVGNRYDCLSPPVLALFSWLCRQAGQAGKPLTVCGEMAGSPLEAMTLVGLGVRSLSVSPHAVGAIRRMVRSLDAVGLEGYLQTLQPLARHSVREQLRLYAGDHGIEING